MTSSLLTIILTDDSYVIAYRENGETLLSTEKKYGLKKLEDFKLRERASYLLLDPLLHILEKISLYERIPTHIHIQTENHGLWIKHIIESYPYTQFYTQGNKMSVTLDKVTNPLYAGHTKKIFQFKV